jgi:alkylation response protein AidB-like acyl-CoA dehydrogenase
LDFEPSEDQRAIVEAVEALLVRHAGPARAIELDARTAYDHELDAALANAGFVDTALAEGAGFLEATLVTEAVARAGGVVSIGASALVAPGVAARVPPGPVALATIGESGPVRFGAHARTLLLDAGQEARLVPLRPGDVTPVPSNFMLPVGRVHVSAGAGESLGPGSAARLRRFRRLALAAEILGTMQAALDVTVEYVKRRRQFGRAIGSFQALQHRLAQCTVSVEGTRWLTYEAAARGAPDEATALAAAQAAEAAGQLFRETHQLTGAMGFTREHDLHVFSMRLPALRLELGGASTHRRAIARARWAAPS